MIGKADPPKPPQLISTRKLGCTSGVQISSGFCHQPAGEGMRKLDSRGGQGYPPAGRADPPGHSAGSHLSEGLRQRLHTRCCSWSVCKHNLVKRDEVVPVPSCDI